MTIKSLLILVFILLSQNFLIGQSISIQEARATALGATVTVRGLVTNGSEFGKTRHFQDGTGGLAAYPGTGSVSGFDTSVGVGDSIEITGVLTNFQGLLELSPILNFDIISSNNPLPEPIQISLDLLNEDYESQLVQLDCISFLAQGTFNGSGTYSIADENGNNSQIYLRTENDLQGTLVPEEPIHLTGVLSQFFDYQLLPRGQADISPQVCFFFTEIPDPNSLATNALGVQWTLNHTADCTLFWGDTEQPDQLIPVSGQGPGFQANLDNLQPGTVYWIQVQAIRNNDTIYSTTIPMATVSTSTGEIQVYFNHEVDESTLGAVSPAGTSSAEVIQAILDRIDQAETSIDVAVYNNNRADITQHLKQAYANGVAVRYIGAEDTQNPALDPPPDFPVVYGNQFALMHNKFMIIDADMPDKAWVMGGSMNWTDANMEDDFNNTLFIQDQSLARAYRLEFNEMWGSSSLQPNPDLQRFGSAKKDNTPHHFLIGGIPVESWFSPSDQVSKRIEELIYTADESLSFALLTFTKDEIGLAVANEYIEGTQVQGLIENTNTIGSEVDFLQSIGVPVYKHVESHVLHHKYGVIDAYNSASNPVVITGSHNWTQAAESSNDENTLVLFDADLARLFQAEFNRRWVENVSAVSNVNPQAWKAQPNPVSDWLYLQSREKNEQPIYIAVYSLSGKLLLEKTDYHPGSPLSLEILDPGFYFIKLRDSYGVQTLPVQKI
jgi:phosphatidylserine/phosphatidylglycerophosphate/cardiolipin synthase-like enzyme